MTTRQPERMSDAAYAVTQQRLMLLAGFVLRMDLDAFLERIQMTETICPLVDPTLYMRGAEKLGQVRDLAVAANEFRSVVVEQFKEDGKTDEDIARLVREG